MSDINTGYSVRFQDAQNSHQALGLFFRQGTGRFIQDQYLGILRKRFGDLGHLHFANAQILHQFIGVDFQVVFVQDLLCICEQFIPVNAGTGPRFSP